MRSDMQSVTTWYLEMRSNAHHRRARSAKVPCQIVRVDPPDARLNRELYATVGAPWAWRDRLPWTLAAWQAYVDDARVATWLCRVDGENAGYVELARTDEQSVEIAYFGLLPTYLGLGLGGHLLSFAIDAGFDMGAMRLWVHTCSLDAPHALANYQARGFSIYDTRIHAMAPSPAAHE